MLLFVESSQSGDDDNCLYVNIAGSNGTVYSAPNVCLASYNEYDGVYTSSVYKCINNGSVQLQLFLDNERCEGPANFTSWLNVSDGFDSNCASTAQDCSIKTRTYGFDGNAPNCNNLSAANYLEIVDVYGMCYQWSIDFCSKTIECQIGMQTVAFYTNDHCDCDGQPLLILNFTTGCVVDIAGTEYNNVSTTCNIPYSNKISFNNNNDNNNNYNNNVIWIDIMKEKLDVFDTLKHEIMMNAQQSYNIEEKECMFLSCFACFISFMFVLFWFIMPC